MTVDARADKRRAWVSLRTLGMIAVLAGACAGLGIRQQKISEQARRIIELTKDHERLVRRSAMFDALIENPQYALASTPWASQESSEGRGKFRRWVWRAFLPEQNQVTFEVTLKNIGEKGEKVNKTAPLVMPAGFFHLHAAIVDRDDGMSVMRFRIPDMMPAGTAKWSQDVALTDDPTQLEWTWRAGDASGASAFGQTPSPAVQLMSWSGALESEPRPRITVTMVPAVKK